MRRKRRTKLTASELKALGANPEFVHRRTLPPPGKERSVKKPSEVVRGRGVHSY